MIKIMTKGLKQDYIKRELLGHYIKTGYVMAILSL